MYSATESESDILGICAPAFNPSKVHTHTHREHTPIYTAFNVGHNGGTWKAKFSEVVLGVKSLRTTVLLYIH